MASMTRLVRMIAYCSLFIYLESQISPVAIVVARASSSSFRACTITQSIVTSGLTIAAVILGCIATKIGPSSSHFESSHQQMGLVLMILLL